MSYLFIVPANRSMLPVQRLVELVEVQVRQVSQRQVVNAAGRFQWHWRPSRFAPLVVGSLSVGSRLRR
jgi:hypothetical protein